MKRNKIWAATVVGATALASVGIGSVWIQAAADQPAPSANQPTGLIVGYKSQAAEAGSDDAARQDVSAKARARGLRLDFGRRLGTGGVLVDLGGADQAALSAVMRAFQADPDVAYVEPDVRMHATAEPNDSEYTKQWHYFEDKAGMRVPGAWSSATGSGVTVAVIDTGYVKHSDLDAKIVAGYDFITSTSDSRDNNGRDSNPADEGDWQSSDGECGAGSKAHNSSWHGTHVAGTIAAATNNGKGVAGVAPDAKIQPVRVLGKCGGSLSDIADAIIWASGGTVGGISANQTPADVINLSLGGGGSCSSTYQSAINGAVQRGTTVVVAAGNSNQDVSGFQPANCNNVVAVASSNREGNRSFYSNYGNLIDVAAPGGEVRRSSDTPGTVTTPENGVWSTLNAGTTTPGAESYKPFMGTSMAAPHVAGLAALALSKKSDLTPAQVEKAIKDNARPLPGSCTGCGAGLADAAKTVASLGGDPGSTVSVTNPGDQSTVVNAAVSLQIKASSSTSGATLSYSATGLPAGLSISSSTGLISGKPTVAGTSAVKVTVTDSANATNSASFNWSVTSGQGGTVTVTKPRDQWSFKGWAIQPLQVQATSTAGGTLTFTASGLPAGLSISSSGLITGTPTGGGPHTVTVTAKDSGGGTGTTTFGWQIYGF